MKTVKLIGSAADVEAAFYDALNRADIDALMKLWADDDDIVCIHPGGPRLQGHAAIQASWESILHKAGLQVQPSQLHEAQNLMSAVHTVVEGGTGLDPNDPTGTTPAHLIATNVYMKTPQGWRMVVHHVSVAPGPAPMGTAASSLH